MASADPAYDLAGALMALAPGLVMQRKLLDAAAARYAANGYVALTAADVPGILATANVTDQDAMAGIYPTTDVPYPAALPAFPVSLPRIADSNEDPRDNWVKYQ